MQFTRANAICLLAAFVALAGGGLQSLLDEKIHSPQPISETSETCEVELEFDIECKDGFEQSLAPLFVAHATAIRPSRLDVIPCEALLRVVPQQNAARPPPIAV